jgi:uncharacterized protein YuzE
VKLIDALPELVLDLEGALLPLGRGDLVKHVQAAVLERWTYDDFSDTVYLFLTAEPFERLQLDTLSLYDELGVNLETDGRGRLCGIEILDGKPIASRLEEARSP